MRRKYYLILGLIALLFLSACGGQSVVAPTATVEVAMPTSTISLATPTSEPQPTPTETPMPSSAICSPLAGHEITTLLSLHITQPFIPPQGANKETGHHGLDFAYYSGGPTGGHINGTPIQSVLDGYVAAVGANAVYGNYLITETPNDQLPAGLADEYDIAPGQSLYLLYAHMQQPAPFELGQPLRCGELVGSVGDSGSRLFLTDPHLHLETRIGPPGEQFAPMAYYTADTTEAEREEYMRWRTGDAFLLVDPLILLDHAITDQ